MPTIDSAEDRSALIKYLRDHPESFQLNLQFLEARPRVTAEAQKTHRMINLRAFQNDEVLISTYYKKISRVLS